MTAKRGNHKLVWTLGDYMFHWAKPAKIYPWNGPNHLNSLSQKSLCRPNWASCFATRWCRPKRTQRNPEALIDFEKANFPEDFNIEVGGLVPLTGPNGPAVGVIQEVQEEVVVLDMNHRLAGKNLSFDLELVAIGAVEEEQTENEAEQEEETQDED